MRRTIATMLILAGAAIPARAEAFCGFFIAGADSKLYNNATVVALMREGTRTALSMQNDYQGPPKDFAMVVPVPVVLQEENVKTLPTTIFDRLDALASPRLVEYWEQDPCQQRRRYPMKSGGVGSAYGSGAVRSTPKPAEPKVVVEAQFKVGEYEIVILSATEALALENWITGNGYKIPKGAATHLQPYVQNGWKFFVAKVDPKKVKFAGGRAVLSPLRFHFDTPDFHLPIRLGLINSSGEQDLIVHILAKNQRYEVANYDNVAVPTNLLVRNSTRKQFGAFYEGLLKDTWQKHPGSVITEYSWSAMSCDPCPDQPLSPSELASLGLDVMPSSGGAGPAGIAFSQVRVIGDDQTARYRAYLKRAERMLDQCGKLGGTGRGHVQMEVNAKGMARVNVMGGLSQPMRKCIEERLERTRFAPPKSGEARVLAQVNVSPGMSRSRMSGFVLTRLHARYSAKTVGDDLIFRAAAPIEGGRGGAEPSSVIAEPSGINQFQGRYIIRHKWTGKIACKNPVRGIWGGPPRGNTQVIAANGQAFARKKRAVKASRQVIGKLPTLNVARAVAMPAIKPRPVPPPPPPPADAGVPEVAEATVDAGVAATESPPPPPEADAAPAATTLPTNPGKADRGCACRSDGGAPIGALIFGVAICFVVTRRRRE